LAILLYNQINHRSNVLSSPPFLAASITGQIALKENNMWNYILISIVSGILFGFLDGLLNANPLARRLMAVYQPIARTSINIPAGIFIDLAYGFALAGLFLLLRDSLPGASGLLKGLSYGGILWFLRVVMYGLSHWITFKVPAATLLYTLAAGLVEMLALGVLYGLTLIP
jgi:hypothetical protein